jgi:hypothetical protein
MTGTHNPYNPFAAAYGSIHLCGCPCGECRTKREKELSITLERLVFDGPCRTPGCHVCSGEIARREDG